MTRVGLLIGRRGRNVIKMKLVAVGLKRLTNKGNDDRREIRAADTEDFLLVFKKRKKQRKQMKGEKGEKVGENFRGVQQRITMKLLERPL